MYIRAPQAYGKQREDQLSGIEDRRRGVPQKRHSGVLLRFPERPPALIPFLLHALVQRVIEMTRIAKRELTVLKERRGITEQKQRPETNKDQHDG